MEFFKVFYPISRHANMTVNTLTRFIQFFKGLTVSSGGTALVLPTSLAPVPVVTSMPVSATTMVAGKIFLACLYAVDNIQWCCVYI